MKIYVYVYQTLYKQNRGTIDFTWLVVQFKIAVWYLITRLLRQYFGAMMDCFEKERYADGVSFDVVMCRRCVIVASQYE